MSEKTLSEIAEQMADAINEWNLAKHERQEWKPVLGETPPAKYLDNARKANVLLAKALEDYELFQHGVQADGLPHCKNCKKVAYVIPCIHCGYEETTRR